MLGRGSKSLDSRKTVLGQRFEPLDSRETELGGCSKSLDSRKTVLGQRFEPLDSRETVLGQRFEPLDSRETVLGRCSESLDSRKTVLGGCFEPLDSHHTVLADPIAQVPTQPRRTPQLTRSGPSTGVSRLVGPAAGDAIALAICSIGSSKDWPTASSSGASLPKEAACALASYSRTLSSSGAAVGVARVSRWAGLRLHRC